MKNKDIPNVQYEISFSNLENLFNVYQTKDNEYFYNLLRTVNIPKDLDPEYFDYYVIKFGDMWPTISYKFYNNVVLWWLLCKTNQIQDPTGSPEVGTTIKVIKPQYVSEILNEIAE